MQCLVPLRIHPVLQRISCMNEIQSVRLKTSRNIVKQCIPDKPKRPGNPYILFVKDNQLELSSKYPDLSRTELMQKVASMWKDADTNVRAQYTAKFQVQKGKYEEEIQSYKNNLTDEQKAAIAKFEEMTQKKKESSKIKKTLKKLGKPKNPPGSFALYYMEKSSELKPGETVAERFRRLGSEWKSLSDSEKEHYKTKATDLRKNYDKELKKWELKVSEELDFFNKETAGNESKTAKSKTLSVRGYVTSLFKKSKK